MFKSWRLGTAFGFPIDLSSSFLLLLAIVLFAFGGLAGVFVVAIAFAGVVLHELGHAAMARSRGVYVQNIELGFFGGAAKMAMPRTSRDELLIAAAGPVVSLALGGLGLGLGLLAHSSLAATFGWINFVIAGFNLIPALPMDGGRILRAALAPRMGLLPATELAVKVSRVAAVGFAILGLMGSFQLLLLAPFIWMMGTRELMLAHAGAPPTFATGMRRFTIRNVNGRMVIDDVG